MLLKSLRIENVRTYEEGEIVFPEGIMLFEGGIGSGKSTLLLAVEFALFGLGNERGTTLLSLGEKEGTVELVFETGGMEYRIHRKLVRTKRGAGVHQGAQVPGGVKQDECWIEADGLRASYAPKEMKEKILKLLRFNEPADPKAKSIIFRYAIYTPQEEMKEILSQPPDQRLQTIRKALRLEDYKVAKDNALLVAKELKQRANMMLKGANELPAITQELDSLCTKKPAMEQELQSIDDDLMNMDVEINGFRALREQIQEKLESLAADYKKETEILNDLMRTERTISDLTSAISINRGKMSDYSKMVEELRRKAPPVMTPDEAEGMLERARSRFKELSREQGAISAILRNYSRLIENGICPTCNRPIQGIEYQQHRDEARRDYEATVVKIGEVESEIMDLEKAKKEATDHETCRLRLTEYEARFSETEDRLFEDEVKLSEAKRQRDELEMRRQRATTALHDYKVAKKELDEISEELAELEGKKEELVKSRAALERDIEWTGAKISELREKKGRLEGERLRAEALTEHSDWLSGFFIASLDRIELSIMNSANREFDSEFGRWFAFLVDDPTKGVRVDEDFTPLVNQDAFEQEVGDLSGGERTALALAYRLALNKVVKRNASIEANLLLLDEPTDGFSKDQIGKMGDLLRELGLRQIIIVSHERELEGAVDHIFRVSKEGGRSKVVPLVP